MANNILNRLFRMNFPDCTREALMFLTSFISQDCPAIPGLSAANTEQVIVEICQEFVLFKSVRGPSKKLTEVQELHLLDMICNCFSEAPEKSKYRIFNLMFGAHGDGTVNLLTKLISLALSVRCTPVLFCAAIWMQERDSLSPDVKGLTQRLVSDYCLLYSDPSGMFSSLPSVSPLFACNFVTSATSFYSFAGADSLPPLALLQHVSEWVYKDNTMCCESLRQAAIHSAYTTPVPGLTGWCVRGPVVCCQLKELGSDSPVSHSHIDSLLTCLDKLHLALLQSLTFTACVNLSPGLISTSDLAHIAQTLQVVCRPQPSKEEEAACTVALERLAQILQVASKTRTYISDRGKIKEMEALARGKLPQSRLLTMVLSDQIHQGTSHKARVAS